MKRSPPRRARSSGRAATPFNARSGWPWLLDHRDFELVAPPGQQKSPVPARLYDGRARCRPRPYYDMLSRHSQQAQTCQSRAPPGVTSPQKHGRVEDRKRGPLGSDPGKAHGSAFERRASILLHGRIPVNGAPAPCCADPCSRSTRTRHAVFTPYPSRLIRHALAVTQYQILMPSILPALPPRIAIFSASLRLDVPST